MTWNIAGHHPKEDLSDLLGLQPENSTEGEEGQGNSEEVAVNGEKADADVIAIGYTMKSLVFKRYLDIFGAAKIYRNDKLLCALLGFKS